MVLNLGMYAIQSLKAKLLELREEKKLYYGRVLSNIIGYTNMNLIFQNSNTHIGKVFVMDSNREVSKKSITATCLSQKSMDQLDPSNGAPDIVHFNYSILP